MKKNSKGRVSATISGWYWAIIVENAVAPAPAIIERKNAAAQEGQPANRPKAAPRTLPAVPFAFCDLDKRS
ncbi:MAG: hypothetical protein ACYCPW_13100, partial [Nitrososphaerales archaeon]